MPVSIVDTVQDYDHSDPKESILLMDEMFIFLLMSIEYLAAPKQSIDWQVAFFLKKIDWSLT